MGKLYDSLKKFFDNATQEELDQAWKEVERFKDVGPTVDEYIENAKKMRRELCSVSPNCDICYRKDNCLMEETERAWKEKIEGVE